MKVRNLNFKLILVEIYTNFESYDHNKRYSFYIRYRFGEYVDGSDKRKHDAAMQEA